MTIQEDISRIFEMETLPQAEKIFLLKQKGKTYPEFFQLTQYLVGKILASKHTISIPIENVAFSSKKIAKAQKISTVEPNNIITTRLISSVRKNPVNIRSLRSKESLAPRSEKKIIETSVSGYSFFSDIPHKKFSALAGVAFALVLSISPDLSLLAATTDISIIPQSNIEDENSLAHAFQTGDFDFQDIIAFGLHLIKLAGILAGMVYLLINVWAGIQYIIGVTMDDKEAGKNILVNALLGFGLVIFSWVGIDIVISFLTTS